jgi:PAS domain S-box-containing protein
VNHKFTEVTGYTAEEAIGQNPSILKSGDQSAGFYKELWETISSGKEWMGELHNKKKNGELYWEYARISPILNESSEIINYLAVKENVTELKQAENNFRHSIDQSPLGIRIVNQKGETVYANQAFLNIYDFTSLVEYVNTPAKERYTHESYKEHLERKKIRKEGKEVADYEISIRRSNGERRHVKIWRKEVIWNKEKHFQVINQDITEYKTLYNDLLLAKEKAEESDRLKSAFLANMSHEIRTPMNGILGFMELLQEPDLEEETKNNYIGIVSKSGHRLLNTINDIIEISKIDAQQVKVDQTRFCMVGLLKELSEFFQPEATAKGIKLQAKLPEQAIEITSDRAKLESVFTNLIKNAIKFTPSGEINVGLEHSNGRLSAYVSDTGVGIAAEKIEHLFERFVQGETNSTRRFEGSGLGLSITKEYVNLLNGKIWVESEVNKGSVFYVEFPKPELID